MKIRLLFFFALFTWNFTSAQNNFPTTGNAGIGTTTPDLALQILKSGSTAVERAAVNIVTSGTGSIYGPVIMLNGQSTTGGRRWGVLSSGQVDAASTGAVGNFAIYDYGSGARMVIDAAGNIGIGTTAPTTKLHVVGQFRSSNFWEPNGNSLFVGRVGNTTLTGGGNTIVGILTGASLTTGNTNTIVGSNIANNLSTGLRNIIVGSLSGANNQRTAEQLTSGYDNVILGAAAGSQLTTGWQNVFIGTGAGAANTTNGRNVEIGKDAGLTAGGDYNTFVGGTSGQSTHGNNNTFLGDKSGNALYAGNSLTFLGAAAGSITPENLENATAVGYNAQVTTSNSLVLGNGANVGIGTTAPAAKLQVTSNGTSIDGVSSDHITVQGLAIEAKTGGRNATVGAQLEFVIPANADGTNMYGQSRIITVAGSANNADATGKMVLGTRRYVNKLGTGTNWYYGDDLMIDGSGRIGINTPDTKGYQLAVNGGVIATSVTVKTYPWPDYVFDKEYVLVPLSKVKAFIEKNHHLPEIPTAAEVESKGLNLGEINAQLTKKVEELTLYIIEKDEQQKMMMEMLKKQQKQLDKIQSSIRNGVE